MRALAVDDDGRRYLAIPAAALALATGVVAAAGVTFAVTAADDSPRAVRGTSATAPPGQACLDALHRADDVLAVAAQLDQALDTHNGLVGDVTAGRLTPQQAVDRMLPVLQKGSQSSLDLDVAVQRYRAAATRCQP